MAYEIVERVTVPKQANGAFAIIEEIGNPRVVDVVEEEDHFMVVIAGVERHCAVHKLQMYSGGLSPTIRRLN